jgi:hypothetical protein
MTHGSEGDGNNMSVIKRWISILVVSLLSCGQQADTADTSRVHATSQAAKTVQVLHASSLPWSYRGAGTQPVVFNVVTDNLGPDAALVIKKTDKDGNWSEEIAATVVEDLPNGKQLWRAEKSYCYGYSCYPNTSQNGWHDFDFYVEAKAGGQTYLDNNGGQNYRMGLTSRDSSGQPTSKLAGHLLKERAVYVAEKPRATVYDYDLPSGHVYKRVLQLKVVLSNRSPQKELTLHYSADNWKTEHKATGRMLSDHQVANSYANIPNPSDLGTEVWGFGDAGNPGVDITHLGESATKIDFYLEYRESGNHHIDNNFGRNYSVGAPIYEQVLLRGTHSAPAFAPYSSMQRFEDARNRIYYQLDVLFENKGDPDRFKLDVHGDWRLNFGENDNNGASKKGVAEQSGGDIKITEGPGRYRVRFYEISREFSVTKLDDGYRRTVVMIEGTTQLGQDMFIRGGIDHEYAKRALGRDCDTYRYQCAIPIRHRNWRNVTTKDWKEGDYSLDWHGKESSQGRNAATKPEGTPLDWTTDAWPVSWGKERTYEKDGYGTFSLNRFGPHYWVLDVEMDCSKTVNGWFELKSYISNGPGWEKDVKQPNAPYASNNHFAQCGKINVFRRGQEAPIVIEGFTN